MSDIRKSERRIRPSNLDPAEKAEMERRWREENAEAIRSQNKWIEENGLPLEKLRLFRIS